MIIGTRRTMPSRSGTMVNRPRPAAASSSTLTLRSSPANLNSKGVGILAEHGKSGDRQLLVEVRVNLVSPGFAEHHPRFADGIGENPVIAGQRPQLLPRRLVETAEIVGDDVGIEPVGLGENDVERDDHGAHPGQSVDDVRRCAYAAMAIGRAWGRQGSLSSISTMVTGLAFLTRGSMRWKASKVRMRSSSTGGGSKERSTAKPIAARRRSAARSRISARTTAAIVEATSCCLDITLRR